jgi:hypothetical protein
MFNTAIQQEQFGGWFFNNSKLNTVYLLQYATEMVNSDCFVTGHTCWKHFFHVEEAIINGLYNQ